MGSGPFTFVEWVAEERITLARNENYWGEASGDVQTLNVVFLGGEEVQVDALGDGEVDMIYPQPYVSLMEEIAGIGHVDSVTGLGPVWEYFGFNQDDPPAEPVHPPGDRPGHQPDAIVEEVVRPITPDGQLLGNAVWLHNSLYYQDHFNRLFPYDPIAAEALLTDNGCVEGEDVIYECGGERLSFAGRPHPATRLGTCTSSWPRPTSPQSDRDNTQLRADIRAPADEQPAGGADVWQVTNLVGRLTRPVLGQLPLLLPGQRLERLRRTELLPVLR